jgi:uncharacterized protein (TIGR03435 family)
VPSLPSLPDAGLWSKMPSVPAQCSDDPWLPECPQRTGTLWRLQSRKGGQNMRRTIPCASLIALVLLGASGQSTSTSPVFEVASVKPHNPAIRGNSADFSVDRFTAMNMPLGGLIVMAYDITVRQISGQDPLLSERYDIAAKAEHAVSRNEMLRMLQALLVERFHLVIHRESRDVPFYALVVGKGGPKLPRSDPSRGDVINPLTPTGAGGTELKSGHLVYKDESMPDFAWALSRMVATGDRVVLDNTGLDGTYDFELTFEPSRTAPGAEVPGTATSIEGPSIFEAVQEQLGLKLEPKKGPVGFLIIDHVERPSAN